MAGKKLTATVINDVIFDRRMTRILTSLHGNGCEVTIIGRKEEDVDFDFSKTYKQIRLRCPVNQGVLFYLTFNIQLFFYLLLRRSDYVYAVDLDTLIPCWIVARLKGAKLIYDAHEWFAEVPEINPSSLKYKAWNWIEKTFVPLADQIITVNHSLASHYKKYGKAVSIIKNYPRLENEIEEAKNKRFTIIYLGVLNTGRGLEMLIEVVSKLADVDLWIAGEGDLSNDLRNLSDKLNIGTNSQGLSGIKFLGRVPPHKIQSILRKCHLGVNILDSKSISYFYSLGNKAFDYIHAGLPAIHMSFPEYEKVVSQFRIGVLLNKFEKGTLLNAILDIKNDSVKYKDMVNECNNAKIHFQWKKEEVKLINLFASL